METVKSGAVGVEGSYRPSRLPPDVEPLWAVVRRPSARRAAGRGGLLYRCGASQGRPFVDAAVGVVAVLLLVATFPFISSYGARSFIIEGHAPRVLQSAICNWQFAIPAAFPACYVFSRTTHGVRIPTWASRSTIARGGAAASIGPREQVRWTVVTEGTPPRRLAPLRPLRDEDWLPPEKVLGPG